MVFCILFWKNNQTFCHTKRKNHKFNQGNSAFPLSRCNFWESVWEEINSMDVQVHTELYCLYDKVNDLELFMFASLQPPFLLFLCFNFALTVWSELLQYGASLCRRARSRRMVWWWSYQTDDNLLLLCAVGEDDQCQISNPLAVNIQRKWKHLKDSVEKWI